MINWWSMAFLSPHGNNLDGNSAVFVDARVKLYRLLRLGFAMCPSDCTIAVVGGLWLDFVAPWRYLSVGHDREESTEAWKEFVNANYFFYHTLLSSLLDYTEVIVESFGDAVSKHGTRIDLESTKTALLPLLLLIAKILAAISPFSESIAHVEAAELLPAPQDISSSSSMQFIRRAPEVQIGAKEQLRALETERFVLQPLFDSASVQRAMRILYWLERIYAVLPDNDDAMIVNAHVANVSSQRLFASTPMPSDPQCNVELKSTIMQCEEELCAIFSISEDGYNEFCDRFEKQRVELGRELLPSAASMRKRRLIPAPTPDERLALKRTVPHPKEAALTHLIKSYEIGLLVKLMAMLSDQVTHWYLVLISRLEMRLQRELPCFIKTYRFNFRFLAAVPNLCFILLSYVILRTMFSLFQ